MRCSRLLVLTVCALQLSSCSALWAQAISSRVADDLLALEGYRGTVREAGLFPDDPERTLLREVHYRRPWQMRVETLEPAELAGSLFVYDGEEVVMWWPQELFGLRIRGLPLPEEEEVRAHIRRQSEVAFDNYAYTLEGEFPWLEQPSARWRLRPVSDDPLRLRHTVWMHARYSFPLKMDFYREDDSRWYGMEFDSFALETPSDDWSFSFPENAVVFAWDLAAPGISVEEARRRMNFEVLLPTWLPEGHRVSKLVESDHDLPLLCVRMDAGATWLSLTQNRYLGEMTRPPFGIEVEVGAATGQLSFVGNFTLLSWVQGRTQLSLLGNIAYPELVRIARSVAAPED